ncbi:hypothetical protein L1887_05994 [Cichorium endivia]|nr:hypothetical protein L1887_05994 [Cichorium endivia]
MMVAFISLAVVQANSSLEDQGQVLTSPSATYIGVCDGDGGPEASRFITTHLFRYLERLKEKESLRRGNNGAYPSPLGYGGFPKSVCTSVNECMCHGIPHSRQLQHGDIINIDVTVYLNGYHGDTSKTFLCGNVDDATKRLVKVTEECLERGIAVCKDGALFRKIGKRISEHAEKFGYGIVDRFVGHGVGTVFHSEALIFHHCNEKPGSMVEGQTFTIDIFFTCTSNPADKNWIYQSSTKIGWYLYFTYSEFVMKIAAVDIKTDETVSKEKVFSFISHNELSVVPLDFKTMSGGLAFETLNVRSLMQDPNPEYKLFATIVHSGFSPDSGHYYAYIKVPKC